MLLALLLAASTGLSTQQARTAAPTILDAAGVTTEGSSLSFSRADHVHALTYTASGGTARSLASKLGDVVSVKDFGAKGDGATDDTAAIQSAINANTNKTVILLPAGSYKITSPLSIPSNTTLRGSGRNFGTTLLPTAGAITLDGSTASGGWVFRIRIENLLIDATNATATNLITINQAYSAALHNVKVYNQPTTVTNGISISQANDIVLREVILYGATTSVTRGINIDGTVQPVSVSLDHVDVEVYNRGVRSQGAVNLDMHSPYMERCIVDYSHETSSGVTNIFGGVMSSVNGYTIAVLADGLNVYGTDLDPYTGASRGGLGVSSASATAYPNVHFYNIPRATQSGFFDSTTNWLLTDVQPPPIANYYQRSISFKKVLADNTATNIIKLANFDTYAKCKLTLHGYIGLAYVVKEFTFILNGNSTTSAVTTTTVMDTSAGNWFATMTLTLTPNSGSGYVMVSATVNETAGALSTGQAFTLYGRLDIDASESGVGGVYLQ